MKQICYTSKTPKEIEALLLSKTEIWNPCKYRKWVPESVVKSVHIYYGDVRSKSFEIIPLIPGRNFFAPIISGQIHENIDGKTQIICQAQDSPLVRRAVIFSALGVVLSLVALITKVFDKEYTTNISGFHTLGYAVLFCLFYIFSYLSKKKYFTKFIHFVQNVN